MTDCSQVFRTKFAELVESDPEGIQALVRNMGWAKHRHESMFKPLSRSVLNICAQLKLAAWIAGVRRGKIEAKNAVEWLQWMDEEKYIQACMIADAGHEAMVLLRFSFRGNRPTQVISVCPERRTDPNPWLSPPLPVPYCPRFGEGSALTRQPPLSKGLASLWRLVS